MIIETVLWTAMLTAGAAVTGWGLEAENAGDNARALAERDAPIEMIVGGAIALPSTTAQAWHDWKNRTQGDAANEPTQSVKTDTNSWGKKDAGEPH